MTTFYSSIFIIIGLFLFSLGVVAFQNRNVKGIYYLSIFMWTISLFNILCGLHIVIQNHTAKYIFHELKFSVLPFIPVLMFLFILNYTNKEIKIKKWFIVVIFIIPVLTIILNATNSVHNFVRKYTWIEQINGITMVMNDNNWWFYVHLIYSYIISIIVLIISIKNWLKSSDYTRKKITIIIFGALIPWIYNIYYSIRSLVSKSLDLTPMFLAFTALIFLYGILRYKLVDISPMSRSMVFDMLNTPAVVIDNNYKVADINHAGAILLNRSINECIGLCIDDLTFLGQTKNIEDFNKKEIVLNNSYYKTIVSSVMDSNNELIGYAILLENITDHKMYLQEIEAQTFNDSVTGLNNRNYFQKRLDFYTNDKCTGKSLAIVIMDLNGLKIINDSFGHDKGDSILKGFATILIKVFNNANNIIRLGGDEFVVIIEDITKEEIEVKLNELDEICKKHDTHLISVSYGYSIIKTDEKTLNEGLKVADINMYKQKLKRSKNFHKIIMADFWRLLVNKFPNIKEKSSISGKLAVTFGQYIKLNRYELTKLVDIALIYEIGLVTLVLPNGKDSFNQEINNQSMIINGYNILCSSKIYSHLADILLHSKESWDGNGYPYGLIQEETPYLSRVLALIKYLEEIILQNEVDMVKNIKKESGSRLDPLLVSKLVEFIELGNFKNLGDYNSITTINFIDY
ncbi:MAG: diguanylate cyclase [Vallitalea sp.]|nr:diguanylate cyclase [Vallitalea sp.]